MHEHDLSAEYCCDVASSVPESHVQRRNVTVDPAVTCPECGGGGKSVGIETVKSNLAISLRRLQSREYRFCPAESCVVVYYASDGSDAFAVGELREKVYQKDPDVDSAHVCYCFQRTVGDMRAASPEARAAIAADITQGTKAGQCACELRNPQGSCCLGNVRALIRRLDAELAPGDAG